MWQEMFKTSFLQKKYSLFLVCLFRNLRRTALTDELYVCLQKIWNVLAQACIQILFDSVPRIEAFIEAYSGHIKY